MSNKAIIVRALCELLQERTKFIELKIKQADMGLDMINTEIINVIDGVAKNVLYIETAINKLLTLIDHLHTIQHTKSLEAIYWHFFFHFIMYSLYPLNKHYILNNNKYSNHKLFIYLKENYYPVFRYSSINYKYSNIPQQNITKLIHYFIRNNLLLLKQFDVNITRIICEYVVNTKLFCLNIISNVIASLTSSSLYTQRINEIIDEYCRNPIYPNIPLSKLYYTFSNIPLSKLLMCKQYIEFDNIHNNNEYMANELGLHFALYNTQFNTKCQHIASFFTDHSSYKLYLNPHKSMLLISSVFNYNKIDIINGIKSCLIREYGNVAFTVFINGNQCEMELSQHPDKIDYDQINNNLNTLFNEIILKYCIQSEESMNELCFQIIQSIHFFILFSHPEFNYVCIKYDWIKTNICIINKLIASLCDKMLKYFHKYNIYLIPNEKYQRSVVMIENMLDSALEYADTDTSDALYFDIEQHLRLLSELISKWRYDDVIEETNNKRQLIFDNSNEPQTKKRRVS